MRQARHLPVLGALRQQCITRDMLLEPETALIQGLYVVQITWG